MIFSYNCSLYLQSLPLWCRCHRGGAGGGSDGRAERGVGPAKPTVRSTGDVTSLAGTVCCAAKLAEEVTDKGPKMKGRFYRNFYYKMLHVLK